MRLRQCFITNQQWGPKKITTKLKSQKHRGPEEESDQLVSYKNVSSCTNLYAITQLATPKYVSN